MQKNYFYPNNSGNLIFPLQLIHNIINCFNNTTLRYKTAANCHSFALAL